MSKVSALIVFRHGSTALNEPGAERVRGWSNVPLSEEGKATIRKSAEAAARAALPVRGIIHSDLKRTTQSARIIHEYFPKAKLTPSRALRTWDTGYVEGKLVEDVIPVLKFYFEHPNERIPDGETYNEFYKRFEREVSKGLKFLRKNPGEALIFVTHSYGVCALEHTICGGCTKIDNKCSVPPGMPVIVELPPNGSYKMNIPVEAKTEPKA